MLARLLAEKEQTEDLLSLVKESRTILLSDVELTLTRYGQYLALCTLYEKAGEEGKLIGTWSK